MTKFTNHDLCRLRDMAIMGSTVPEIAQELGCARATVRYWAAKEKIAVRREREPIDDAVVENVLELASLGLTRHQIASRLGMSPTRVRWTAKRFAIPLAHGATGRPRTTPSR